MFATLFGQAFVIMIVMIAVSYGIYTVACKAMAKKDKQFFFSVVSATTEQEVMHEYISRLDGLCNACYGSIRRHSRSWLPEEKIKW